jgi:outer membrane protein assembly factor BamB
VRTQIRTTILGTLVLLGAGLALAADWPQWRGPNRDGISAETGLLKEWPKEGPKLLWQLNDIGYAYSTPAVVGGRLYLLSNKDMENEFVQAFDAADGKQIWSTRIGKVGVNNGPPYPGARSTPTVDGELLYALGSDGDLVCLEVNKGVVRWQKKLQTDFGGKPGLWAYAESPLIDGDVLVCTPGDKAATMVALNKQSGQVIWKAAVPGGDLAGYASPIVVNAGGHKQYVNFMAKGVVSVDAATGKFLWRYDKTGVGPANIPTPIAHNNLVYSAASRFGGGLVKLEPDADGVKAEQVYYERDLPNGIGGAVQVGDFIYGTGNQGLVCGEFTTGKIKWQEKTLGPGAVCCADGRIYVHCDNGKVALAELTPDGYHEKGNFTPADLPKRLRGGEKAWCYPVVANGKLYIRDLNMLWCYDIKGGKGAE